MQKIGRLGRGLTGNKKLYFYFENYNFDTYYREYTGKSETEDIYNEDIIIKDIYVLSDEETKEKDEEYVEWYVYKMNLEYTYEIDTYRDLKEQYDCRKSIFIRWYDENYKNIPSDKVVWTDWDENETKQLKLILKEIYNEYKKYFDENEKFFINFIKNEMKKIS
jgi:hypothetical protein